MCERRKVNCHLNPCSWPHNRSHSPVPGTLKVKPTALPSKSCETTTQMCRVFPNALGGEQILERAFPRPRCLNQNLKFTKIRHRGVAGRQTVFKQPLPLTSELLLTRLKYA